MAIVKRCLSLLRHALPENAICKPVFFPAAFLTVLFVALSAVFSRQSTHLFSLLQTKIIHQFGWFYLLAVAIFMIFCLVLTITRYGDIKLGMDHSEPEYSYRSWFAMLFSAGMGVGLIFYGVAEPVSHYMHPPVGVGMTEAAARSAMAITFFHWGINAWAIYAVVGLGLAYFSFRYRLPLSIRSALYPLLGDKIYGPIGHLVDVFAIVSCIFGVATSLGIGVMQINAGMHYLFGMGQTLSIHILLICIVTGIAALSVALGLDKGMKWLSNVNILLAVILLLFLLIVGNTTHLLDAFSENIGNYLDSFIGRTFNIYAYEDASQWMGKWTLFYWGWWIAWSPFVGMFIARVSKGRTIREFIWGVLFIPAGFTFLWFTVLGNSALSIEMLHPGVLSSVIQNNMPLSFYTFLSYFPWSSVSSVVATVLIVTFFVTSADSGAYVIDAIASGGKVHTYAWQRVFWAIAVGMVAAVLLASGGLGALQTAVLITALPFSVIMLFICYSLIKGFNEERIKMNVKAIPPTPAALGKEMNWRQRLDSITSFPEKREAQKFLFGIAFVALKKMRKELVEKQGLDASIKREQKKITLKVDHGGERDFFYCVQLVSYDATGVEIPGMDADNNLDDLYFRAEVYLQEGSQHYDILGYTEEQVINDALEHYDRHMHYLHSLRER